MLGRILLALIACVFVAFAVLWIMGGGLSRAVAYARTIGNPLDLLMGNASGQEFRLPGQPDLGIGPDIGLEAGSSYENAIYDTDYGGVSDETAADPQTYGDTSPHANQVHLAYGSLGTSPSRDEYLYLEADSANAGPVSLERWSLQSMHSKTRVALPPAAAHFTQGIVNPVRPISLEPGDSVIVVTGPSPVGVSFRENECSGYLAQHQEFTPAIQTRCPYAADIIGDTPQSRSALGEECFSLMQSLLPCEIPATIPTDVSPACRSSLAERLSYNACVQLQQNEFGFYVNRWRVFLNAAQPLWQERDIIRLLDAEGRVVDVLSY